MKVSGSSSESSSSEFSKSAFSSSTIGGDPAAASHASGPGGGSTGGAMWQATARGNRLGVLRKAIDRIEPFLLFGEEEACRALNKLAGMHLGTGQDHAWQLVEACFESGAPSALDYKVIKSSKQASKGKAANQGEVADQGEPAKPGTAKSAR